MSLDNVYSFTVQRQNSSEVAPGKSPCVKIKFIKDESVKHSPKYKIGPESLSGSTSNNGEEKPDLITDDVSAESSPLSICPIFGTTGHETLKSLQLELLKIIEKKDCHMIFAYPVTEEQAPNYSSIIDNPIDLQTIHHKIDRAEYENLAELVDDMMLMCQNALIYNTSDTVYYKIAVQMLNHVKKTFARDGLHKFVSSKLNWTRGLTEAEIGDLDSSLTRLRIIQSEVTKNVPPSRPQRALSKNNQSANKRKSQFDSKSSLSKRLCIEGENYFQTRSRCGMTADGSPESEIEDNSSQNRQSELSDDDADDEEDNEGDAIEEVLASAQRAAHLARQRLMQSQLRPVVYLDKVGDEVALVGECKSQYKPLETELQTMVSRINSVNVEHMIGENDRVLAQLGQLCHDTNEAVTLTTSRPLEPYSCAEQAVLVETFGDVVTAEFACNMHNFVLDFPLSSVALSTVRQKLNTATNYLTYGVDQIIVKKLKAAAETSKS